MLAAARKAQIAHEMAEDLARKKCASGKEAYIIDGHPKHRVAAQQVAQHGLELGWDVFNGLANEVGTAATLEWQVFVSLEHSAHLVVIPRLIQHIVTCAVPPSTQGSCPLPSTQKRLRILKINVMKHEVNMPQG